MTNEEARQEIERIEKAISKLPQRIEIRLILNRLHIEYLYHMDFSRYKVINWN